MKEKKPQAEIILFRTEDEKLRLSVLFEDETVWLTQEQMAALFEKGRTTITEHIRNIFEEGELDEKVVCRKFRHTTQHGAIEGKTQTVSVEYVWDLYLINGAIFGYNKSQIFIALIQFHFKSLRNA